MDSDSVIHTVDCMVSLAGEVYVSQDVDVYVAVIDVVVVVVLVVRHDAV